jgi:aspartate aminotransferase-like enzyme/GNAT superfamily N-acetyltransferase
MRKPELIYKIASQPREFELIHALNYRTFVEEIPQHHANAERRLVDRFHAENTYVVCLADDELAGMVALRGTRPFSLDAKLPDLQSYLPEHARPCEVRLLAVDPGYRNTGVLAGLVQRLARIARLRHYDLALISGTTRQLKLYGHFGFVPFGPRVGTRDAEYQPMMLTLERFEGGGTASAPPRRRQAPWTSGLASLLPGPVDVQPGVQRAFLEKPVSHRSEAFASLHGGVQRRLASLAGAPCAAILLGSGTLANDVVGGQLLGRPGRGLVLTNGEFGDRLVDHATRWRLEFDTYRAAWGEPFDPREVARRLQAGRSWIWFVHCETSTGMLNDLPGIQALASASGAAVCVDAISSFGLMQVDLGGVHLATAVSGKGLGALPGLAIVFHRGEARRSSAPVPRYLDLDAYTDNGTPYTHSSNLLSALAAALGHMSHERYASVREDSATLRAGIRAAGLECLAREECAAPGIITVPVPPPLLSADVALQLAADGYLVAHGSRYLRERNWIQVALMGAYPRAALAGLPRSLQRIRRAAGLRPGERIAANIQ